MTIASRTSTAVPWAMVEILSGAVSGILSTYVVGRMLSPADLGRAGAVLSVVTMIEIISAVGMSDSLIRCKSSHTKLTDTAFSFLLLTSFAGVALCWIVARPLSTSLNDAEIETLLKGASLLLPLGAIDVVPVAIFTRKLRLDVLAKRGTLARAITLVSAVTLAYWGLGAWSLVGASLVGSSMASISLFGAVVRWPRPRLYFKELQPVLHFGLLTSAELLITTATTRLFLILFGVFHGVELLGYLQFAQRLVDEVANLVGSFTLKFALSIFSRMHRLGKSLTPAFLNGTSMVCLISAPMMLGLGVVSSDILHLLYGDRWSLSLPYVWISCVSWTLMFPTFLVGPTLRASGKQAPMVAVATTNMLASLAACVATSWTATSAAPLAWGMRHFFGLPVAIFLITKLIGVRLKDFLFCWLVPVSAAAIMAFMLVYLQMEMSTQSLPAILLLKVLLGVAVYIPLCVPTILSLLKVLRSLRVPTEVRA